MLYNFIPVTEIVLDTPRYHHLNLELMQWRFNALSKNHSAMVKYGTNQFCYQAELANAYATHIACQAVNANADDYDNTAEFCHLLPLLASEQILKKDHECDKNRLPHKWAEIEFAICYALDPETTSEFVASVLRCFEESLIASRVVRRYLTTQNNTGVRCALVESVTANIEKIEHIQRPRTHEELCGQNIKPSSESRDRECMSVVRFVARLIPFGEDADLVFGCIDKDGNFQEGILHKPAMPFLEMLLTDFEEIDLTDRLRKSWFDTGDDPVYSRLIHNKPTGLNHFSLVFA